MTPNEKSILRSLVAVAWADGTVERPEEGLIEGLLWAFGADEAEEKELLEFAKQKRTFKDVALGDLTPDDRALLLAHAALLTHADGEQSREEKRVLAELVKLLGYTDADAKPIIAGAKDRVRKR